ncbi:hypothetical protein FRC07_007739 [Ceratobasidium sp. 392]|nr:hypothetical protein FRC07_007739 [Ceratobasidium sp. 392]
MPIAHRRPGLLHLVLPHPALDQAAALSPSPALSPHTPRRTSREGLPCPRTSIASDKPRSSIDSWNSVDTNELVWEWKDEELALLSRTLDNLPSHLMTPYVGVVPPPNVLDKLARNIALSRTALEWPHSVRATRVKLHELCRSKTVQKALERRTPAPHTVSQNSPQVTEIMAPTRRPLYRQSSMDFLPVKNEPTSVTRLSSRLQRTDRLLAQSSFHPYARPSGSRSPTPPLTTEVLTCSRSRSITPTEASARPSTPRKLFRSSATPPPQPSLKRAPSFGVASIKSRAQRAVKPEPGSYSSDEEERARQAMVKRPRVNAHRVPSFLGAPLPPLAPSPEEEILDPLVIVPEDPVFAPTLRKAAAPTRTRSGTVTPKPSTPKPAAARAPAPAVTPAVPGGATTPRTLRRVGTRNFPGSSTPVPAPATPAPAPTRSAAPGTSTGTRVAIGHKPRVPAASSSANPSDEERRRERRERKERREREKGKESQPSEGTHRSKKRTPKEPVPSVAPMRL